MRLFSVAALAAVALVGGADARSTASAIEGTWNYGSGLVLVRATGPTAFEGTIVETATFSSGCAHPVGERMWTVSGGGPRYTGTHYGFSTTDTRPCAERQRATYPATFEVAQSGSTFTLRFCTLYDGKQDCATLSRAKPPAPVVVKNYLWGANATSFGAAGSAVATQKIFAEGKTRVEGARITSTSGTIRVVQSYRNPAGKQRRLWLRVTGPLAPVATRAGGGGNVSVRVVVASSQFSNCSKGGVGSVTIVDGAGRSPDSLSLAVCGTRTRYVHGATRPRTQVFALVGLRRS